MYEFNKLIGGILLNNGGNIIGGGGGTENDGIIVPLGLIFIDKKKSSKLPKSNHDMDEPIKGEVDEKMINKMYKKMRHGKNK